MTMQVCLFLIGGPRMQPLLDGAALQRAAEGVEGLSRLIVHEPLEQRVDPRIAASSDAPSTVLQWYFDDLAPLEAACAEDGAIHRALQSAASHALSRQSFAQQVMAVRTHKRTARFDAERCTYLVAYEGIADNFNAWLSHYLEHHPPLMLQLPALRELEIYTRLDSRSGLPFAQANAMQRNKVVFDDASALATALASPVRDAMRRDFHALPPFTGATPHFAMRSNYGNLGTH
jgi:uncharacterized protein (TIGR02118 family)